MAVADVFTALTEDRPYRDGMTSAKAVEILQELVDNGDIDGQIAGVLEKNLSAIDDKRQKAH